MGTVSVHHLTGVGWGDLLDWCRSGGVLGVDGRHDHSREAETENTSTEGGDDGLDEELSGQGHERGRVVGVCPPYLSIIGAGRPWWQWVQLYYIGAHRGLIRVSDALLTNWGALCYTVQDYCKHQQMAVMWQWEHTFCPNLWHDVANTTAHNITFIMPFLCVGFTYDTAQ